MVRYTGESTGASGLLKATHYPSPNHLAGLA